MKEIILCLLFSLPASLSFAESIEQTPIEDMIRFRDYIVQGEIISTEVISVEYNVYIDQLHRYTTLRVDEVVEAVKSLPDTIVLRSYEGFVDDSGTQLSLARLQVTDNMNVIVFFNTIPEGYNTSALECYKIVDSRLIGTDTSIGEFKQQVRSFLTGSIDEITCRIPPLDVLLGLAVSVTDKIIDNDFVEVYPNPANPVSYIFYSITEPSHVELSIYSAGGQKITSLVDEYLPAGKHQAVFDGIDLASGIYIYRLVSKGRLNSGKLLLVK